jgi:hypothetical protein
MEIGSAQLPIRITLRLKMKDPKPVQGADAAGCDVSAPGK